MLTILIGIVAFVGWALIVDRVGRRLGEAYIAWRLRDR